MPQHPLRVLIVEDNPADARLVQHELKTEGYYPDLTRVEDEAEFVTALAAGPEVVLCDWSLPQFDALRALEIARERAPDVPFIIVSGSIGEEAAVQAIKLGATDYLLKDRLGRLGQAVKQALAHKAYRDAERRAREDLLASEARYRALADCAPQLVWTAGPDGGIEYLNRYATDYAGLPCGDLAGWSWERVVHADDLPRLLSAWDDMFRTGVLQDVAFRMRRSDGAYRWHIGRTSPVRDAGGAVARWVGVCINIHDQKTAAELLAQDAQILAGVRDSVIVTDLEGIVTYWNEGATRLFGWSADEMVGRPYASRFPEPARPGIAREIRERANEGEWYGEYEDWRKDGTRVWIQARVGPINDAAGRPIGILGLAYDLTERKRAEEALAAVMQSVVDAVVTIDGRGTVRSVNPAAERLFGYSEAELVGRNVSLLMPEPHRGRHDGYIANYLRTGEARMIGFGREVEGLRKDGTRFPAELSVSEFRVEGERHFTGVVRDVSGRRRLEEQYRQAQKMEAVGQLAGGVAHDFNNLLTIINGFSEILLSDMTVGNTQRELLTAVRGAGERAAGLTRQLLAFSRKAIVEPRVLDLNEVVESIAKMLQRLIGEDVVLTTTLSPGLAKVMADAGQVEQVIMNLAVNARDAMPKGGRLTIETSNIDLRADELRAGSDLQPGRYVRLRVIDTGCGMTPEVKAHIFEPFFTTKGVGKGTGLGLATVFGIVKQAGGDVTVESGVGQGATFTITLPVTKEVVIGRPSASNLVAPKGTETVLLAEDEGGVRKLARMALEMQGYAVLEAASGGEVLEIAANHAGSIHLLVTDVVMPEVGGRDLAEAVRSRRPGIKVLYMSGYTDDAVVRHGVSAQADAFLQKPFTPLGLARKVRAVLDATA